MPEAGAALPACTREEHGVGRARLGLVSSFPEVWHAPSFLRGCWLSVPSLPTGAGPRACSALSRSTGEAVTSQEQTHPSRLSAIPTIGSDSLSPWESCSRPPSAYGHSASFSVQAGAVLLESTATYDHIANNGSSAGSVWPLEGAT